MIRLSSIKEGSVFVMLGKEYTLHCIIGLECYCYYLELEDMFILGSESMVEYISSAEVGLESVAHKH